MKHICVSIKWQEKQAKHTDSTGLLQYRHRHLLLAFVDEDGTAAIPRVPMKSIKYWPDSCMLALEVLYVRLVCVLR